MNETTNAAATTETLPQALTLYDYRTGEELRTLTIEESVRYLDDATDGTGAVDGHPYGVEGTVYSI